MAAVRRTKEPAQSLSENASPTHAYRIGVALVSDGQARIAYSEISIFKKVHIIIYIYASTYLQN